MGMAQTIKDKLTIVIPIKIDHEDRLRNVNISVDYLRHYFDCEIIICEQDIESKLVDLCKEHNCKHIFIETAEFFNKLKLVNLAVREVTTPAFALYDADALLRPEQLKGATNAIVSGKAQMVYPYDGKFYDVPEKFFDSIKDTRDLTKIDLDECILFNPNSVGGCVMFDVNQYWKCGGSNENFKSVGYDDPEMYSRFQKLGTKIMRTEAPLWHLTHWRGESSFNHNPHIEHNKSIYANVLNMTQEQLQSYVDNFNWV
jgi:hypothetical protein